MVFWRTNLIAALSCLFFSACQTQGEVSAFKGLPVQLLSPVSGGSMGNTGTVTFYWTANTTYQNQCLYVSDLSLKQIVATQCTTSSTTYNGVAAYSASVSSAGFLGGTMRWWVEADNIEDTKFSEIKSMSLTQDFTLQGNPGFNVSSVSGQATKSGGIATFSVQLTQSPIGQVVLPITSNKPNVSLVSPSSLTFDSVCPGTNCWSDKHFVTIKGLDDGVPGTNQDVTIQFSAATGNDTYGYIGKFPASITLVVFDSAHAFGSFSVAVSAQAVGSVSGTISGTTVSIPLSNAVNRTVLVPTFTYSGAVVMVSGIPQISGVTPVNLTSPVTYTVMGDDGTSTSYTVQAVAETIPPTPGGAGALSFAGTGYFKTTVVWIAASDNADVAGQLQYLLYSSTSNNINTVALAEANGTPMGSYTAAQTNFNVINLKDGATYYFNVIVKDVTGNKAAYTMTNVATLSANNIAGLKGWWRADSIAVANGSPVDTWNDVSTGAANPAGATAGARPTFLTNAINGFPAVTFDGTNNYMAITGPIATTGGVNYGSGGSAGVTVFAVFQGTRGVTSNQDRVLENFGTCTNNGFYVGAHGVSGTQFEFGTAGGNQAATTGLGASTWTILSGINTATTSNMSYNNGALEGNNGTITYGVSGTPTCTFYIGSRTDMSTKFLGKIAEILVYNLALTTTDRQSVECYLSGKYGITLTGNSCP